MAHVEQRAGDLGMACLSAGLEDRRLVGGQAEPGEAFEDLVHRRLGGAFLVGVLDAQQVGAAMVAGEEVIEQRGARPADMQVAGGGGSETGADGHDTWASWRGGYLEHF